MALSNDRISDPTKASRFWINSPRNTLGTNKIKAYRSSDQSVFHAHPRVFRIFSRVSFQFLPTRRTFFNRRPRLLATISSGIE